jgi:ectoine hydroxylase-related dioxygenase (phytanoyl-CoA dioxygenase family)
MIDLDNLEEIIIQEKNNLKSKSKNYIENFLEIEKFITDEIISIEELNKNNKNIIPEVKFDDLKLNLKDLTLEVKKRGCVVIRDVFDDDLIIQMNKDLEQYIEENNYYEDQKKKADIDKYFSDLKSGKPQIFGLYWSKPQVNIRQSIELDVVKKWLNQLWTYKQNNESIFDPNHELVYADRVRRREPGDSTLGLSPHCDAGSVERWIDKGYQAVYEKIFADNFKEYDPFDAAYRNKTKEIESPAVSHVFRTFQGWVALTEQGPGDGTLQLIPIAKSMAYILTRALLDDVDEKDLCSSMPARALSVNSKYHSLLLRGLVSIPKMNPGDTVWWHPDVVHAVEDHHTGKGYSNVVYVGSTPYCEKNLAYAKKQSQKFLEGKSPPDFAAEDYEVTYKNRATIKDLTLLGKKQLAL